LIEHLKKIDHGLISTQRSFEHQVVAVQM